MQAPTPESNTNGRQSNGEPIVILDIGCRWGFADRFIGNLDKDNFRIYGFDPDEEECRRLQIEYSSLPDGFVKCIPLALAEAEGKRNLYVTNEPACSSFHLPKKSLSDRYPALSCIGLEKVVVVDVVTLGQWAKDNDLKSLDYIKIDTQGSELEILKGAGDLIDSTRCIDIEVEFNPIYEGQSLFSETDAYLRTKGFVLWRLSNLVHYSIGGELMPLDDCNSICFDLNIRQETQAFGGQLFWADARYVHSEILKKPVADIFQNKRDVCLLNALGMADVVHHINLLKHDS